MARKPRLLVLAAALALAFSLLALTAAEALAGSSDRYPPKAALMKGPELMQTRGFTAAVGAATREAGERGATSTTTLACTTFPRPTR